MRSDVEVRLGPGDRERLEAVLADRNSPEACLAGTDHRGHGRGLRHDGGGVSKPSVWRWQRRFMEAGVDGLLRDKTRKPGKAPVPGPIVTRLIERTLGEPPGEMTHWTSRAMAKVTGLAISCFSDHRRADQVIHALPSSTGQRIVAVALGYEDVNDYDTLRRDPVLALFSDQLEPKRKDCAPMAGKSTVNRLEDAPHEGGDRYHKIGHDAKALERVFADIFLDAHGTPEEIVLDLDATDDPLHGHQEGRFFHGYYDSYCYLPLYVFCGRHLLAAKLLRANIDAAAGAKDEVARLVAHIYRRWPKVRIVLKLLKLALG